VLPGLVNAHSHAFQRAIAGLTERRSEAPMRPTTSGAGATACTARPAHHAGAAGGDCRQLYAELLAGGYTQVCDFHYLHNDSSGAAYADPGEMSLALVRAAQRTGIGLTLLPTLYMRSGFKAAGLREDQRRFSSTPESVMRMVEQVLRRRKAMRASTPAWPCTPCAPPARPPA
jgi:formimidoylglutamate deiminase